VMTKTANVIGAIFAAATLAAAAFVAGRWSTTSWPIVGDACVEYGMARAAFVQAEREI
jgi:hypothetical protein